MFANEERTDVFVVNLLKSVKKKKKKVISKQIILFKKATELFEILVTDFKMPGLAHWTQNVLHASHCVVHKLNNGGKYMYFKLLRFLLTGRF